MDAVGWPESLLDECSGRIGNARYRHTDTLEFSRDSSQRFRGVRQNSECYLSQWLRDHRGVPGGTGLPGTHPGLVVLHEDWGLTDWVKEQTRKLAGQGYVALAVDLYRGQLAHDPAFAYELMVSTPPDRALQDMEAAIHFLIARTDVNKDKIGSIGWSAGGKWSLLLAINDRFLGACVSNYGAPPTDPAEIQKIHAPVLAIFAAGRSLYCGQRCKRFRNRHEWRAQIYRYQNLPASRPRLRKPRTTPWPTAKAQPKMRGIAASRFWISTLSRAPQGLAERLAKARRMGLM